MQQDSCSVYYTNNPFLYSNKVYTCMNNAFFEYQVGVFNIAMHIQLYFKLCRKKKYWSSAPADR